MNDIIAFVEKAMKENLDIKVIDYVENAIIRLYGIDNKCFGIDLINDGYIILKGSHDVSIEIKMSEMDIALFKVEVLKMKKYSENKVIEYFNNFFEEEDFKPTTINDLDSEDD
ncbi:MAG: hypothetical protein VZS44_07490 [Bacilli bacterium]|nr:hypothetical protein [Bacilli bacterium]